MNDIIKKLSDNHDLTVEESKTALEAIMSGASTPALISAFLIGLRIKGETSDEIIGASQVMRQKVKRVKHNQSMVFDNCGTGGDNSGTFNISTTASFVVAGCGVPVAKHGNSSVSSKCGSADLLKYLGVNLNLSPEQLGNCIDKIGIGFLFAPNLHPAMKEVMPVRKELGIRTIFNLLGPLTNPAFASHQMIGIFDRKYVPIVARAAGKIGIERVMTVYNTDGIDEITTSGANMVCLADNGSINEYDLNPEEFGLPRCNIEDLKGGETEENADITMAILNGEKGPKRDTIVFSAAVSLYITGAVDTIMKGIKIAADCLDSGSALNKLNDLINLSNEIENA